MSADCSRRRHNVYTGIHATVKAEDPILLEWLAEHMADSSSSLICVLYTVTFVSTAAVCNTCDHV